MKPEGFSFKITECIESL